MFNETRVGCYRFSKNSYRSVVCLRWTTNFIDIPKYVNIDAYEIKAAIILV